MIVDPLSRYLPWMSDYSTRSVGMGLQALRDLTQTTGVTVVMLQSFNKMVKRPLSKWGEPTSDGTERVRGSSELVAGCDTAFLVTRGRNRNTIELVKSRQGRTSWTSHFSIVDGLRTDPSPRLHLVFEAIQLEQVLPPRNLAELVERRFKKVMRAEPRRIYSRAELARETEKLVGKVGKSALAQAFVLLGRDEEIRVEHADKNLKLYRLAEPVKATYNKLVEEGGQLAAADLLGKQILADAKLWVVEREIKKIQESKHVGSELEEVLKRLEEEKGSS